jgi:hypothetical protein
MIADSIECWRLFFHKISPHNGIEFMEFHYLSQFDTPQHLPTPETGQAGRGDGNETRPTTTRADAVERGEFAYCYAASRLARLGRRRGRNHPAKRPPIWG